MREGPEVRQVTNLVQQFLDCSAKIECFRWWMCHILQNSSAELGKHKEGTVIDVIREMINSKGIKVVWTTTYPAGWVKSVTSRGKVLLTALKPASEPEPEPEPYQVGSTGITPRWCKKCKVVFMSASCPAQHANFM